MKYLCICLSGKFDTWFNWWWDKRRYHCHFVHKANFLSPSFLSNGLWSEYDKSNDTWLTCIYCFLYFLYLLPWVISVSIVLMALLFMCLSIAFWNVCVAKYESTGSWNANTGSISYCTEAIFREGVFCKKTRVLERKIFRNKNCILTYRNINDILN